MLAGALGLALACDLIIAREGVRFGTPEINVGVFPFMIMALIYRNVGRKKTNELLLLGEQISAEEAERIGIVNTVVPADEFDAAVADWAAKLAAKSPVLMRLGKDAMFRQQDMAFADALEFLQAQLTHRLLDRGHPGGREGLLREARPGVDRAVTRHRPARAARRTAPPHGVARLASCSARRSAATPRACVGEPAPPAVRGWEEDLRARAAGARGRGGRGGASRRPCSSPRSARSRSRRCRCSRRATRARSSSGSTRTATSTRPRRAARGYLGGMPLAAACGLWDSGYGAGPRPARAWCSATRATSIRPSARRSTARACAAIAARRASPDAVRGERVFLHLDLDILDPSVMAAAVPAPGGLTARRARGAAARPGRRGDRSSALEVTAFDDPRAASGSPDRSPTRSASACQA